MDMASGRERGLVGENLSHGCHGKVRRSSDGRMTCNTGEHDLEIGGRSVRQNPPTVLLRLKLLVLLDKSPPVFPIGIAQKRPPTGTDS